MELFKQHGLRDLGPDGEILWPGVSRGRGDKVRGGEGWARGGAGEDCQPSDVPRDGEVSQPEPCLHPPGRETVQQRGPIADQVYPSGEIRV